MKARMFFIDSIYGKQVFVNALDTLYSDIESPKSEYFEGFCFSYSKLKDTNTGEEEGESVSYIKGLPLGLKPEDIKQMIRNDILIDFNNITKSDRFIKIKDDVSINVNLKDIVSAIKENNKVRT